MPIDPARLSARVRDVLRGHPGPAGSVDDARPLVPEAEAVRDVRLVPDDEGTRSSEAVDGCVLIERAYPGDVSHGRRSIAQYAGDLETFIDALAVLAGGAGPAAGRPARPGRFSWDSGPRTRGTVTARPRPRAQWPLLFFDLETTGLSGGVGTIAFLVGCGWFEDDGFRTHQFFLGGFEQEREMLMALAALLPRFNGLVTFNGATFDVPLIEMRYAFHRLTSPFEAVPHVDMLHPARRLWRRRESGSDDGDWTLRAPERDSRSCALKVLEEVVLKTGRVGDVPGFEIPALYFDYLRSGTLGTLETVFEHNRLDLLSLAALTAHAARMAGEGPEGAASPHEALAMGRLFERAGRLDEAASCYARAGGFEMAPWGPDGIDRSVRVDGLRQLAYLRRRQRRYQEAADVWQAVLHHARDRASAQEARQALAVYHEHRSRDLASARTFAEKALATERDPERLAALRHRLDRLTRKQAGRDTATACDDEGTLPT